jgi:hypothetical protein
MKRLLFVLPLLIMGLVSCSSCAKQETVAPPCDGGSCTLPTATATATATTPPAPPDQVFSEDDWSVTIPTGWAKMEPPEPAPELKLFYGNKEKMNLVIFVKEAFPGTNAEYVLEALRGIKDGGGKIAAARQVDINGNKFVLVDSSRDNIRMWMWILAKNGFGYALSCGGPVGDTGQEDICTKIANTVTIK